MRQFFLLFLILVAAIPANAAIIHVPQDQPTIQLGIDAALDGDTVLVADGVYQETITFPDMDLLVASQLIIDGDTTHITKTVIDGGPVPAYYQLVFFPSGTHSGRRLRGFSLIRPAHLTIACINSIASSEHCRIVGTANPLFVRDDPDQSACKFSISNCEIVGGPINLFGGADLSITDTKTSAVSINAGWGRDVDITNSIIDGSLTCSSDPNVIGAYRVEASDIHGVVLAANSLVARSSVIRGGISGANSVNVHLRNCQVLGAIGLGTDATIDVDSCVTQKILTAAGGVITARNSTIKIDLKSGTANLAHCTLVGAISNSADATRTLRLDTCNVALTSFFVFDSKWSEITMHCTNISTMKLPYGQPFWIGEPGPGLTMDTTNVTFLPPYFCNPDSGDFHIADISPCAPANNACQVLIGALDVNCTATPIEPQIVHHVPSQYPTIQSAIDAASDGDTVLVADGIYNERIHLFAKSITVASNIIVDGDITHIGNTIIDPVGLPVVDTGSAVLVVGNFLNVPALRGFTIRNGQPLTIAYGPIGGSGIFGANAYRILVSDCVFDHNDAAIDYRDAVFERCDFVGAGVNNIRTAAIRLKDCTVDDTIKSWGTPGGNAGTFFIDSSVVNDVQYYGRGRLESTHSTFVGNIVHGFESNSHISHCVVYGFVNPGIEGRIYADHTDFSGNIDARSGCQVLLYKCLVASGINTSGVIASPPLLAISNSTVLGSINGRLLNSWIKIDSSIVSLTAPLNIEETRLVIHCSDIFVDCPDPMVGTPQSLDTSDVIFSDPIFCDPVAGDYRIKNTSPCAPANNSCGVLIGAFAIGCYTGDLDGDDMLSLSDAVFLINYIFNHGPAPDVSADLNCDGKVNLSDAVFLINHLFDNGPPPSERG